MKKKKNKSRKRSSYPTPDQMAKVMQKLDRRIYSV
jgi:hypothetical protein